VFGNGVWNVLVHWAQVIIKLKHILSYNFECLELQLLVFGYGLVQIQKTIILQEHCGVWPSHKFEWFQYQISKR
jgi:hypothetical protein